MLEHITQKCPKLDYDEKDVKKFENHLKNIGGFSEAMERRHKSHVEKVAKWSESKVVPVPAVAAGGTTQLVKSRQPPLWSGQKFDRWKAEVERWNQFNRANDEEKFLDLMESLKKNEAIRQFVNNTLIEKVGETRTVTKILEEMSEKYDRNMGEKTSEMMRKISGEGFKSDESVDKMIDRFGDMIVEMKRIRLAENLDYAMGF